MNNEAYTRFTKDMSYSIKRVAATPERLDDLNNTQLKDFQSRVEAYTPRTDEGQANKELALTAISVVINGKARPEVIEQSLEVGRRIAENSCVLEIHVRQPGFTKKIDSATFLDTSGNKGSVDAGVLHVSQDLIDKKRIKGLEDHRNWLLDYIKGVSVPGGLLTLGNGQFLVPLSMIDAIYDRIQQFDDRRQELLDEFEAKWDEIKNDAKVKRGAFYNESDYPPFYDVRARYTHDYKFISNTVPAELEKVSAEIRQREEERIQLECASTAGEISQFLREGFHALVAHFADRLGVDDETGKPKRFNGRRIDDLKEFLTMFQNRNLTGDDELAQLCDQAKQLIEGVDADKIRNSEELRGSLKKAFDGIAEASDALIEIRPRKVRL